MLLKLNILNFTILAIKMGKKLTLEQRVAKHKYFEKTDFGKIRCTLTGHEFPMREEDFKNYQLVSALTPKFQQIVNHLKDKKLPERARV